MKRTYVSPTVEVIKVKIEKGFAISSTAARIDTTIDIWQNNEVEYHGTASEDNSGLWGEGIDWNN